MYKRNPVFLILILVFTAGVTASLVLAATNEGASTSLSVGIHSTDQPQATSAPASSFPSNAAETYKIEVNQDGIYKITPADLAVAGMNVAAVDPNTIEMMHRGQPLAYKFVGDSDATFESTEYILFYGWAFDGPRTEKQFINNNVFWLWAGGTRKAMGSTNNSTGGEVVTSLVTAVTAEPENIFTTTYTDQWDTFPNEPDNWYWDLVLQGDSDLSPTPITRTYPIDLPYLTTTGPETTATYTVELLSREQSTKPTGITYTVHSYVNDYAVPSSATWIEVQSINITDTIPLAELSSGPNNVSLVFDSSSNAAHIFLNRITVEYQRQLTADNDELIFSDMAGGSREFRVNGFTETTPANVLVWNVTVPTTTVQIPMSASNIINDDTYTIGSSHAAGAKFIATTINNVHTPTISQYVPASLEPQVGGADWLAISHADFATEAQTLAAHRASFSNLQTMVVDIEDIVNQYGYGLPLPSAIRDYLNHSLSWTPWPRYVVIFGGATLNPRNLDCQDEYCPGGLGVWDKDQKTFVVTDLVYEDRFQGLIPSDHALVMLDNGNDPLLPDMAIGRIPANTADEAESAVTKIIQFETNQLTAVSWQKNILFVADNADEGGNFCLENQNTINNHIPGSYQALEHCLPDDSVAATEAIRNAMLDAINGDGVSILNYRGHGSVTTWAKPSIISSDSTSTDFWQNVQKPVVILSADCLDGNFAFPGLAALSATLLTLKSGAVPVGTAAHWSSTGLGYTWEHSLLHQGFYDGLFQQDKLTIGDAIDYAKINYHDTPGAHDSEMYSFLLQGDPAMQLFTMRNESYLPAIMR